jgi:hypothetical protein
MTVKELYVTMAGERHKTFVKAYARSLADGKKEKT